MDLSFEGKCGEKCSYIEYLEQEGWTKNTRKFQIPMHTRRLARVPVVAFVASKDLN
jgi:hypothetical protein